MIARSLPVALQANKKYQAVSPGKRKGHLYKSCARSKENQLIIALAGPLFISDYGPIGRQRECSKPRLVKPAQPIAQPIFFFVITFIQIALHIHMQA
ncbi:hypothetical protein TNCT_125601 [Trichonephila clavata]|uniref:Uncharacterized protein n=1 Tax=Trichonephila clavata TaxID=2740835 RepID=A0A8X6HC75_TRICU|nr:hypothetical protein TNCT_125601 [Trichonephila clavata]